MNKKLKKRIENKLDRYIEERGIEEMCKLDIVEFIKENMVSRNRCNYYSNIRFVREVLRERGMDVEIKSSDYLNIGLIQPSDRIFTKEEVLKMCDYFINYSDKFLIYALFNGIMGKSYDEIRQLKVTQVSDDYKVIHLENRDVKCDEYLSYYLKKTIKEDTYKLYIKDDLATYTEFYYNMNSQYVLKPKPSAKNNQGLNYYSSIGLQNRIKKLTGEVNEYTDDKIVLSGKALYMSHVLHELHEYKDDWNIHEISKFLKEHHLNGNVSEVYRNYHEKYKKF